MSTRTFTFNVTAPQTGWVPEAGTFKNISLNTMADVRPAGWPPSDIAGPFSNWSGGVYAPNFGAAGGYVVHGSGHLSTGTPLWSGVWVFDIASLQWVGRNVPAEALLENTTDYNALLESILPATLGHTKTPHTYDGLVYWPDYGTDGALIRFGNNPINTVHEYDLSSATSPGTRRIDNLSLLSAYPRTAYDAGRNGVWVGRYTGSTLGFVSLPTYALTTYGAVFNDYGDHSMIYVPTRDCLVDIGRTGVGGVDMSVRVCPIVNGTPQGWTLVTPTGTRPADARCGGVWSSLLNCVVCYEANGSYRVHKLLLPDDLTGGTWQWVIEDFTGKGVDGATPCKTTSNSNGAYGRFAEAPEHNCFIWCDSVVGPVQAWRLTGM